MALGYGSVDVWALGVGFPLVTSLPSTSTTQPASETDASRQVLDLLEPWLFEWVAKAKGSRSDHHGSGCSESRGSSIRKPELLKRICNVNMAQARQLRIGRLVGFKAAPTRNLQVGLDRSYKNQPNMLR